MTRSVGGPLSTSARACGLPESVNLLFASDTLCWTPYEVSISPLQLQIYCRTLNCRTSMYTDCWHRRQDAKRSVTGRSFVMRKSSDRLDVQCSNASRDGIRDRRDMATVCFRRHDTAVLSRRYCRPLSACSLHSSCSTTREPSDHP